MISLFNNVTQLGLGDYPLRLENGYAIVISGKRRSYKGVCVGAIPVLAA